MSLLVISDQDDRKPALSALHSVDRAEFPSAP